MRKDIANESEQRLMPQTGCPDREYLAKLPLTNFPNGQVERLEENLLDCDDCSQAAETINVVTDEMTLAFASAECIGDAEESLAEAKKRAKQFRSQAETMIGKSLAQAVNANQVQ